MENRLNKKYMVKLTLKSPLHINAGEGMAGYRSIIIADKRPIIPASTIKGKMKNNFARLTDGYSEKHSDSGKHCSCSVCSMFGGAGFQPSRVYIENFILDESQSGVKLSIRTGTAVDRYRKVAKDESLYKTEILENGVFTGLVEIYFTEHTIKYEKELLLSLKMIETIGGGKSRGFGFVEVEVENCV